MDWWLIEMIVMMSVVVVLAAWFWDRIRKNQRSQLLSEVAATENLQKTEDLAEKLGISLVPGIGFRRKNLHWLVFPESLGRFTCSLLKAKESDPVFDRYIQGIASWLFDHYSYEEQRLFFKAMRRHSSITDLVIVALRAYEDEKIEGGKSRDDERRKRQLRAWGE